MSPPSHSTTDTSVDLTEAASADELSAGTSRAVALTFLKENEDPPPPPSQSTAPTDRTSQVPPLTPRPDITPASVKPSTTTPAASTTKTENPFPVASTTSSVPSLGGVASPSTPVSTTHLTTPVIRRFTSTTTIRTQTSRRTFTPFVLRTVPPRAATTAFISPFTTTTEATPQQCNITERMWVKTVVSIYVRRNRLDSIQRQNLRRGLSQGLRKALNDSSAQAQVRLVLLSI
ncbi:mucin-2-like [Cynoglossus semilaevis]|uniref:mucin-2-like n=1 Tax=Cynoglossus semilaevis TaxID=244447 RepID=UPI000D6236A8|nr:mucin-2-like [Cynoglossus semilaevis]